MTNKTQIDLYREYVRVSDMCDAYNKDHGTDIKPWKCVRTCDGLGNVTQVFYEHPKFDAKNKDAYKFAIAILDGQPVWIGDKVYHSTLGHAVTINQDHAVYGLKNATWTPPTKKRTFMLQLDNYELELLEIWVKGWAGTTAENLRNKLTAARDKEQTMFKLILIITLISPVITGHQSTTVASSQGEYVFTSKEKCQNAAKLLLEDKFKDWSFYRQAYCVEQ